MPHLSVVLPKSASFGEASQTMIYCGAGYVSSISDRSVISADGVYRSWRGGEQFACNLPRRLHLLVWICHCHLLRESWTRYHVCPNVLGSGIDLKPRNQPGRILSESHAS